MPACYIQLVMTSLWEICVEIPVMSIEFLKCSTFATYQNAVMMTLWGIIKTKK